MAAASSAESSDQAERDVTPLMASGDVLPQIFRREGEYWTVAFDGLVCRLRHTRGMQHLSVLLGRPGERVPAIELAGSPLAGPPPFTEVFTGEGTGSRTATRDAERARVNVTRHLSRVISRIAAHHPALGRHLETTIRTGTLCSYTPDSRLMTRWEQ